MFAMRQETVFMWIYQRYLNLINLKNVCMKYTPTPSSQIHITYYLRMMKIHLSENCFSILCELSMPRVTFFSVEFCLINHTMAKVFKDNWHRALVI